ncbi:protein of unknown function, might belong to Aldehyde oxidase and xanthine dehydrogenase molybdopterin binding [Shewanella benthica]|uniref:Aldehyde oxidase/xanthine dehydrogenase second molybdopterin binding domain-containing protein n=1 Tax=Shewanella benthica TaxID=43661 RepID=A0A330M755_9GAMM|nr:protein of unknown function, might belong to Aldehyde oxidase and xanthine dehydrogenase molybdopterin binding [Shewanella benthica]
MDIGRYRGVIDAVEQAMEKAGTAANNQGWGFAVHRSFTAFVATALLVKVSEDKQLKVLKAISAIDAGTVVNPDRVKSQTEGAVMLRLNFSLITTNFILVLLLQISF